VPLVQAYSDPGTASTELHGNPSSHAFHPSVSNPTQSTASLPTGKAKQKGVKRQIFFFRLDEGKVLPVPTADPWSSSDVPELAVQKQFGWPFASHITISFGWISNLTQLRTQLLVGARS